MIAIAYSQFVDWGRTTLRFHLCGQSIANMNNKSNRHELSTRQSRIMLSGPVHACARHIAFDLGISLGELLAEAALLVCHHYGKGDGLPQPMLPEPVVLSTSTDEKERGDRIRAAQARLRGTRLPEPTPHDPTREGPNK